MKGFKQSTKMSHGGHYCWGGKVMKKAEGGDVKSSKVKKEDNDRLEGLTEDSKKSMGLPISVYDKGKYDPKASKKIMNENFDEGLRQEREEFGKQMKEEYGDTRDYSFKFPSEDIDSALPKGRSYKTKAAEGMKRGGSVMKKADGGRINLGSAPQMKIGGGSVGVGVRNPPALGQLPLDGSGGGRNPPALGISKIGNPGVGIGKPIGRPKPRVIAGFKNGIDNQGRGVYDAAPPNIGTRLKKGGSAKSKGMK